MSELGGHPLVLRPDEMQLSRGEAMRDTALVLSRHVTAIGLRTGRRVVAELAQHATVPVINMLSAAPPPLPGARRPAHPARGVRAARGRELAYVGDGNNVARSLALLGALAGMHVALASPPGYALEPDLELPAGASGEVTLHDDPRAAVEGAAPSTQTCG